MLSSSIITIQSGGWRRARADVRFKNESDPLAYNASEEIVNIAVERAVITIFEQNFVPWKFNPRNSNYDPDTGNRQHVKSVKLQQNQADPTNGMKASSPTDESYTLSMPTSGDVVITANSSIGLSYGLTTFSQLFFLHSDGGAYTKLAPVLSVMRRSSLIEA
ncbi:Glucosamine-6-phosphate isomerase (Glucosamine-6-phosphate deaminase) (GNPDA) (GlcN6P deaminase) [Exophiala xenobiotica]|nr:Glucosamine-6-phosphate isomerase (Glucosamine-6-phosphate deaminase) (GNPDA) (GlcN6P deaminase) [Exophiala xenobiotica]